MSYSASPTRVSKVTCHKSYTRARCWWLLTWEPPKACNRGIFDKAALWGGDERGCSGQKSLFPAPPHLSYCCFAECGSTKCAGLAGSLTCFTMLFKSLFSSSKRCCSRSIASLSSKAFRFGCRFRACLSGSATSRRIYVRWHLGCTVPLLAQRAVRGYASCSGFFCRRGDINSFSTDASQDLRTLLYRL